MAPYGLSITMGFPWRGKTEEFSNVFHYDAPFPTLEAEWPLLVQQVANTMKVSFSSEVSFLRGRIWGPTNGSQADSLTRYLGDIGGVGGRTTGTDIPKELSVVTSLYMGRNPATGRKRFLRKYWHCGKLSSGAAGGASLGNTALPVDTCNDFNTMMNAMKSVGVGSGNYYLCTPSGDRVPPLTSSACLPHLHTRQLHQ
jgi:hypothetical protein